MRGLESAILAIFQNGLGLLCPVGAALKNPSQEFKNYFCFACRLIPRKTGRGTFCQFSFRWIKFKKPQNNVTPCVDSTQEMLVLKVNLPGLLNPRPAPRPG